MRAAPPAGGVGGIAAVRRPAVALVLVQPVELAHVLGVAHRLEHAHILARGEHERPLNAGIDADDALRGELLLVQLRGLELGVQRPHEVAPDQRLVDDGGDLARGDLGQVHDVKVLLQKVLAGLARSGVVVEDVEGVVVLVLRIDAVARKAAAQAVAPVVHGGDGAHDLAAADPLAGL